MASPHLGARSPWPSIDSAMLHHELRSYRDPEPLGARLVGILFTLFTAGACASLFSHRVAAVRSWSRLPYIRWLVILQYAGAFLYTIFSSIIQYGFNADDDMEVCNASAAVCIMLYAIMKGLLYLFLADRLVRHFLHAFDSFYNEQWLNVLQHVVRSSHKSRKQSKLFLVHTIGIGISIVALAIIFIFLRMYYIKDGVCIIGVQRVMMIIGVTFDALINTYLTGFFLYYLSKAFNLQPFRSPRGIESLSSNDRAKPLEAEIKTLTKRTTIGLGITLIATISNLVTMTVMNGEVIWLCFLTCKADILLCVFVLHYMSRSGRRRIRQENFSTTERSVRPGSVQANANINAASINDTSLKENPMGPGAARGPRRMSTLGGLDMESIPAHLVGIDDLDDDLDVMDWRNRSVLQHAPSTNGSSKEDAEGKMSDAV